MLERLILTRLQIERATDARHHGERRGAGASGSQRRQQNSMDVDQLRARLAQDGMSFTSFRNNLRDEIVTQKLRQSFAQSRINVSEAEVDAALATASAAAGQQFHLAHVLVAHARRRDSRATGHRAEEDRGREGADRQGRDDLRRRGGALLGQPERAGGRPRLARP